MLTFSQTDDDVQALDVAGSCEARSLSEMIRHEVDHATEVLTARAHRAEARLSELARRARHDARTAGRRAIGTVRANPLPTGLLALGVGLILAAVLVPKHHA